MRAREGREGVKGRKAEREGIKGKRGEEGKRDEAPELKFLVTPLIGCLLKWHNVYQCRLLKTVTSQKHEVSRIFVRVKAFMRDKKPHRDRKWDRKIFLQMSIEHSIKLRFLSCFTISTKEIHFKHVTPSLCWWKADWKPSLLLETCIVSTLLYTIN